MGDNNTYKIIENLLDNWDNLTKDNIKERLIEILPPICPKCNMRYDIVEKYGREINKNARFDAASTLYALCSNCHYVHSYTH